MTLREQISSAAQALTGKKRKLKEGRTKLVGETKLPQVLEFFKWFFFCYGIIGLVAYDSFLGWIKSLSLSWFDGAAVYGILSYEIVDNVPLAGVLFAIILTSGCVTAALQRYAEKMVGLGTLSEATKSLSGLSEILDETTDSLLELKATQEKLEYILSPNLVEINGIGPKTAEKLGSIGIYKTPDLLKIAPDDLAEKMGISRKIIAKWLEEAAKCNNRRRY